MPNVLITKKGMDFILSAHQAGVFIDLEYFVPVYDDRIDPTIRDVVSANTDVADTNLTEPIGEIIWNQTGYSLDSSGKFIISAAPYSSPSMQNSYQKSITLTNLHGGSPLSNQISADSWEVSGGSSQGLYNWTGIGNSAPVIGNNSRPTGTTADFWKCSDYYPVYDTSSTEELRGSFKCIIENTKGTFKFNKIALYAIAYQDGVPTGEAAFFGEAYLGTPAVVSNMSVGYDRFEYDIQIDVSGVSANFDDIFFSSSADYWAHSPGGLYWPGMIGVGEFVDNQKAISATIHARKAKDESGKKDVNIPILRMDYDNNCFVGIDVDGNRYDVTQAKSDALSGTDIILCVANWSNYCGDSISIHPKFKSIVSLGTPTHPFREIHVRNANLDTGSKNTDNIIPANFTNNKSNYAVDINGGSVYLGASVGAGGALSADPFGIRLNKIGVDITDDRETVSTTLYGAFRGGDLVRNSQNLLIYNTYYVQPYVGAEGVENVYIFAGLNLSATYTSVDSQVGPTHKNIIYEIENKPAGLFCSQNSNLASTSELILGAKGKIGLFGPVELRNIGTIKNTALLLSKAENSQMGGYAGDYNLVIGAGFETSAAYGNIINKANNLQSMQDILNDNSKLFLIAKNIYVDSNITPLNDGTQDFGSLTRPFGNIYTDQLFVKRSQDALDALYERTDIDSWNGDLKYIEFGNLEWLDGIYKDESNQFFANTVLSKKTTSRTIRGSSVSEEVSIGLDHNKIDNGFFTNFKSENLTASNLTASSLTVKTQLSATSGVYERNRPLAMGEWKEWVLGTDFLIQKHKYFDYFNNDFLKNYKIVSTKIGKTAIVNGYMYFDLSSAPSGYEGIDLIIANSNLEYIPDSFNFLGSTSVFSEEGWLNDDFNKNYKNCLNGFGSAWLDGKEDGHDGGQSIRVYTGRKAIGQYRWVVSCICLNWNYVFGNDDTGVPAKFVIVFSINYQTIY